MEEQKKWRNKKKKGKKGKKENATAVPSISPLYLLVLASDLMTTTTFQKTTASHLFFRQTAPGQKKITRITHIT